MTIRQHFFRSLLGPASRRRTEGGHPQDDSANDKTAQPRVNGHPVGYPTSNDFVMPAMGTNPNVMGYLDDIYAYLRARSDGVIGRGRPEHEPVTQAAIDQGDACLGFAPSPTSQHASTRP
jgi:hypothetical protein